MLMAARITIVTAGHLATCPRMLKAADTLHDAGYQVKVISTSQTPWAASADRRLHARRGWRWQCIPYDRSTAPWRWFVTGVRSRLSRALARMPIASRPMWVMGPAFSRVHAELVRAIVSERQDFVYGGTSGAIAAVTEASRRTGTPCGIDFEDFHCGEHTGDAAGSTRDGLAAIVMADAVRQASFVTVGSAAIARACEERFGVAPITINNVFPLPASPGLERGVGPLRLYWFSQTIGPGRGLEDIVAAVGRCGIEAELHLRGRIIHEYGDDLATLSRTTAPRLRLVQHQPRDPDEMVNACRGFDIGLAVEPGHTLNNALSLSNKALTYPLAGLAMAMTRTPGQRVLIDHLGEDAVSYAPGRFEDLAAGLERWHEDRSALRRAQEASWSAACTRWRWDHPLERDALLEAVRRVA
jgi:hypothetical protein